MGDYWKKHYDQNSELFKDSLYKQVGKTVNGFEVDEQQIRYVANNIINVLRLGSNGDVVDLCCGNGLVTRYVADAVKSIVGVDYSDSLIAIAKTKSSTENIHYVVSDVCQLKNELFKHSSKCYMYEALQHFSLEMLSHLLTEMSNVKEVLFFIGSIPDKEKLWAYYDTEEKKEFYRRCEKENTPHMGRWWLRSEIQAVADQCGYKAKFLLQNKNLYTSYYRFDCLLEKDGA